MKPKTYWALGVLGVAMIIGAGVFLFIQQNLSQIAQFEQDASDEKLGQDVGKTSQLETAPKPKKRGFWSADPDKLADRMKSERVYAIRMQLMRPRDFTVSAALDAAEEAIPLLSVSYDALLNHDDHLYPKELIVDGGALLSSVDLYPSELWFSRYTQELYWGIMYYFDFLCQCPSYVGPTCSIEDPPPLEMILKMTRKPPHRYYLFRTLNSI